MNETEIRESHRLKDMPGRTTGMPLKKPTKEFLEGSIIESKRELDIVEKLKKATLDYMGIYDCFVEESTDSLCLSLGRLEFSIVQRKQMLADEIKECAELEQ